MVPLVRIGLTLYATTPQNCQTHSDNHSKPYTVTIML